MTLLEWPLLRRRRIAVLATVIMAAFLRVPQWTQGLPEFLEEAWPLREAWAMWGWNSGHVDLNPHRFHYPSLTFYLHYLLQLIQFGIGRVAGVWPSRADLFVDFQTDPGGIVVAARALATVFELAGIGAIAWIGERIRPGAGLVAGLFAAFSVAQIHAIRAIVPDTYMTAIAMFALLAMLAHLRGGSRISLVVSVVAVGLATGAKYPAAMLLVPLAIVLLWRDPRRAGWRWILASAGAFAVFLVTTPFAVLDLQSFLRDLMFVSELPEAGQLGLLHGTGSKFQLLELYRNIGPLGALLLPLSLVMTLRRWRERREEVVLWTALIVFLLPVLAARVEASRYLLPAIAVSAALAASALIGLLMRVPERWRTVTCAVGMAVLCAPLVPQLVRMMQDPMSTEVVAAQWFVRNQTMSKLIVQEAYGASLRTRMDALDMQVHPLFQAAGVRARQRYLSRPSYLSVQLPFTSVGVGDVVVPGNGGEEVTVPLVRHAVDLNHLSYEPRLFRDVDYVVVTDGVRGRFMLDTLRFAAEHRFYQLLDRTAAVATRIVPTGATEGPAITIYRTTPAFQAAIEAMGPLDPLWWAETLPIEGRRALEAQALPPEARTGGAVRDSTGAPAAWVLRLGRMYESLVRPFAHPMSVYLTELGHPGTAQPLAEATLEVMPWDIEACLVYTTSCEAEGAWSDARRAIDRTIAWVVRDGEPPPALQLEYARILARTGEAPMAREILRSLASRGDERIAAQARAVLAEIGG